MSNLPAVPPGVAADAVVALPSRLRRRLDEILVAARDWPVAETADGYAVTVDAEIVVTLARVVDGADDIRCGCLLAPRCLHRAAVATLAPIATESRSGRSWTPGPLDGGVGVQESHTELARQRPRAPGGSPDPDIAGVGRATSVRDPGGSAPTKREVAAAGALWEAASAVLTAGIAGSGAVPQAVLLRAAHQARAAQLPWGAAAAVRTVEHLRAAHREDPGFRLAELVGDLRELLLVAHGLRAGRPLRGVARREYQLVGARRLYGLCCEPIVTASGYAGVAVHLVDDAGQFWQVANVTPGGVELAVHQPDSPVSVGEARLTYRELGHAGLLTTDLHASADGRISTGRRVRAVGATGVGWSEPPLAALWEVPIPAQVARYHAALDLPLVDRPAGHDLLFMTGRLAGATRTGVVLASGTVPIHVVAPYDSPRLPYVDNLRLLANAVGLPVRLVGRLVGGGAVEAIAISGEWVDGHVDLGVDRLRRADLPSAGPPGAEPTAADLPTRGPLVGVPSTVFEGTPPLHLLGRRVERAVEGGRGAAPGDPRDADRLRELALPTAADLVDRLESACRVSRDAFGRVAATEVEPYARAWLDAAVYLTAAARSVEAERWSAW